MRHALMLAHRNLGQVWPNPAVGCVLVKDGQVVGRGWTSRGGRPHAETIALQQAGAHAGGATAYITLEPCAHRGQTGPCAQALIDARVAQAIIACRDPDPRVNGQGVLMLRAAGIAVHEGICQKEALHLNAGFFRRFATGKPYVALKIATSLDGKIAYSTEEKEPRRWITGVQARAYGHLLRSRYDAILTGIGTVLADDPLLTCRLKGLEDRSPVRVVLDSANRLPQTSALVHTAVEVPLWVIGGAQDTSPSATLSYLSEKGITRVLIEGGKRITTSFLQSGFVDKVYWFRAPVVIGEQGLSCLTRPDPARFALAGSRRLGEDTLEVYTCLPASSPILE